MKKIAFFLGITILLVLSGSAKAQLSQDYLPYPTSWSVYGDCPESATGIFDLCNYISTSPYAPVFDCTRDPQTTEQCVGLVYDDVAKAIVVLYSPNKFQPAFLSPSVIGTLPYDFSTNTVNKIQRNIIANYSNYSLPYDVWFDSSSNIFYIMTPNSVYTYNLNTGFYNSTALWSIGGNQEGSGNCGSTCYQLIGIAESDKNNPLVTEPRILGIRWTTGNRYIDTISYYLKNGSTTVETSNAIDVNMGAANRGMLGRGFVGTTTKYDIIVSVNEAGDVETRIRDTLSGFPASPPKDGIHYWDGSNLIYHASQNLTANITGGLYKILTTDLTSFGLPSLYYPFNTSINENIRYSYTAFNVNRNTLYHVTSNQTGLGESVTRLGVKGSSSTLYPIRFLAVACNYYSIGGGCQELTQPNQSVTINCNDGSYGTTGYGNDMTISMPCSNITAQFINPTLRPTYAIANIDLQTCLNWQVNTQYTKPYTAKIIAIDGLTFLRVPNATVNLGGIINTTNSNGEAYFSNIYPLDNPYFNSFLYYPTLCMQDLLSAGNPIHNYYTTITADNYRRWTSNIQLAQIAGYSTYFLRDYTATLQQAGVSLNLRLRSADGYTMPAASGITNITGNFNRISYILNGSNNNQSYAQGNYPQNWQIYSTSDPFNVSIAVTYVNQTYSTTATLTNGTNDICVDGECQVDIIIPQGFSVFPCDLNTDCIGGACYGTIFNSLIGCRNQKCSYQTQLCALCDSVVGCFQLSSTTGCSADSDCSKTCISTSTARYGYCGSGGVCLYKDVTCASGSQCANTTINVRDSENNIVYNYTAGICPEHKTCLELGESRTIFQIRKEWVEIGFIFNPYSVNKKMKLYGDNNAYCSVTQASSNKRYCISGANVPITEPNSYPENNFIFTQPSAWQYTIDANNPQYYRFYDISYNCDLNCQIQYQFCQYGCNAETGFCYSTPIIGGGGVTGGISCNQSIFLPICSIANSIINKTTNMTLSQSFQAGGYGFVLIFLTPIFWLFLVIISVMILASYATKHMEIGGVAGLLMLVAFAVYFPELVWITIIIIIIGGYLIGRQIVRVVQGG